MIESADHRKDKLRPRLHRPGLIAETLRTIVFVVVVVVLFDMVIPRSLVEGRSMQPNFETNDRLVVSRLHYLLGQPERGDIVVFNSVDANDPYGTMLIKRVIGIPGDTIETRDDQVYVNGQALNEPYVAFPGRYTERSWTLGLNEYFMMGDNRSASKDSRVFGPINLSSIVGEVIFRYWPVNTFGIINGHQQQVDANEPES